MNNPLDKVGRMAKSVRVLARSGLLGPFRPNQMVGMALAARRYGLSAAGPYALHAARGRDRLAVIDELGEMTFGEMEEQTSTLAAALAERDICDGARVGVMCRNHRWFIEATVALAKAGADALYLNTGFAAPQLAEVLDREGATALILDEEFLDLCKDVDDGVPRIVAWHDDQEGQGGAGDFPTIEELLAGGPRPAPRRSEHEARQIILTSGTTGTPKGAHRAAPTSVEPLVALLDKIPLRTGDIALDAPPMFHAWGLGHLSFGMLFGSTLVLRRRFDPEETLRLVQDCHVTVLPLVPVMLQRIMELPAKTREQYDTSSLRIIALSGSALPGELATKAMDAFGDILYNLYGSTEVAWVSIATPEDLRAAPGTAGRPPIGTVIKLVDDDGDEVPEGETGRIFVGNDLLFEGYTGGGSKDVLEGLMSSGDMGHMDSDGRLFVDGRDDDMIVSGGENVFPREVEDLLSQHEACADVAVVGVPDEKFGQRLKAFVVLRDGQKATEDELKAHVNKHLARYKVPRDIEFLDELPRNATGKVLKKQLMSDDDSAGDGGSADDEPDEKANGKADKKAAPKQQRTSK
jgi:acyl-CoA synthetase (AMP-forming)/AMP-acid ligase II